MPQNNNLFPNLSLFIVGVRKECSMQKNLLTIDTISLALAYASLLSTLIICYMTLKVAAEQHILLKASVSQNCKTHLQPFRALVHSFQLSRKEIRPMCDKCAQTRKKIITSEPFPL